MTLTAAYTARGVRGYWQTQRLLTLMCQLIEVEHGLNLFTALLAQWTDAAAGISPHHAAYSALSEWLSAASWQCS